MIQAGWAVQCLSLATTLGIPELLASGPRQADELATVTRTHAPSLTRVLRMLVGVGVLHEVDGAFGLTPAGHYLRRDVPESIRAWVLLQDGALSRAMGELGHTVATGESAFERVFDAPFFQYLGDHPELGQLHDESMTELTLGVSEALIQAYDFSGFATIVDVGGGHGALLAAILAAHPAAQGILFDRTRVVEQARGLLNGAGVLSRCQLVGGSFFKSAPPGGDAYVLKSVIRDWGDEQAITILCSCRRAMREQGKILLVERMLAESGTSSIEALLSDVTLLALGGGYGGRERTLAELRALLDAAGCALTRVVDTRTDYSILEAVARP
jgi:hypothetical protein